MSLTFDQNSSNCKKVVSVTTIDILRIVKKNRQALQTSLLV